MYAESLKIIFNKIVGLVWIDQKDAQIDSNKYCKQVLYKYMASEPSKTHLINTFYLKKS